MAKEKTVNGVVKIGDIQKGPARVRGAMAQRVRDALAIKPGDAVCVGTSSSATQFFIMVSTMNAIMEDRYYRVILADGKGYIARDK